MTSEPQYRELGHLLEQRRMGAGFLLLDAQRQSWEAMESPPANAPVGLLAQWVDAGYDGSDLLRKWITRLGVERGSLPLSSYLELRSAEGLLALRKERPREALEHFAAVLALQNELPDPKLAVVVRFWRARSFCHAGELEAAHEAVREAVRHAQEFGLTFLAAAIRTLEAWVLFKQGEAKQAEAIFSEADSLLHNTDDFLSIGNIESGLGSIALREGRCDRALEHFEASLEWFAKWPSLDRCLARSLGDAAETKRLIALQLRRNLDFRRERMKGDMQPESAIEKPERIRQHERIQRLLDESQTSLARAGEIYRRRGLEHGAIVLDIVLAQILADLGELVPAAERSFKAFQAASARGELALTCRARIAQANISNARFEEQAGEGNDVGGFAELAHDFAREAVELSERTQDKRLKSQAYLCLGMTQVNGFFHNIESARACRDRAEAQLKPGSPDTLWEEIEILRSRTLHAGLDDPKLRAWSQGSVGDKSLQEVVTDFEELLIRRVWERESRKVSRVAQKLAVSPKKVRRILRRLGLLLEQPEPGGSKM